MPNIFTKIKKGAKKVLANKTVAEARTFLGNRYGTKQSITGLKMGQVVADVARLKNLVNVEKKQLDIQFESSLLVGQCSVNGYGYYVKDVTPIFARGVGSSGRTGDSIKLTGASMRVQLRGQTNCSTARKLTMYLVRREDQSTTVSTVVLDMFDPDVITSMIDLNSQRNVDHLREAKIIAKKSMYLPVQFAADVNTYSKSVKDYAFNFKLNNHLRYDRNTDTPTSKYFVIILCNTGNLATTPSTLVNIANPLNNTGVEFEMSLKFWCVDN